MYIIMKDDFSDDEDDESQSPCCIYSEVPTRSLGINLSSDPCLRKTLPETNTRHIHVTKEQYLRKFLKKIEETGHLWCPNNLHG